METPKAEFKFLFLMCNDVHKIKNFYGDVLGLTTDGNPDGGYLSVEAGISIVFFKGDYELPLLKEWAWQPGYKGGHGNVTSWSFSFPEKQFRDLVLRIQSSTTETLKKFPEWRRDSYWGMTVKDPMGNTLELYSVPKGKPDHLEWSSI